MLVELKAVQESIKATSDGDGDVIEGYFSAFGNVDRVDDLIPKGAFAETLAERAGRIVVKRNHRVLIGQPLELAEKSKGLWGALKISQTDGEEGGKNTLTLARDGALKFGSIAFSAKDWHMETRKKREVRILDRIELYELGPVDEAANESAVLTGVKGADLALAVADLPQAVIQAARAGQLSDEMVADYAKHFAEAAEYLKRLTTDSHDPSHGALGVLIDALRTRGTLPAQQGET